MCKNNWENNTGKNTIAENLQPKTKTDNYSSKFVCEMSYSSSQKKISTDEKLEKLKLWMEKLKFQKNFPKCSS